MNNTENKPIPPLEVMTGTELLNTEFPPLQFAIKKLLPQGIFILAGSGKIGKSWLSLDMCIAVSTGGKLWDYNATEGEVLYIALEDTYPRLQSRLQMCAEENISTDKLYLAISSLGITDGLIEQVRAFISAKPNTKLIIIDTFEHIRNTEQDKTLYACDYRDIKLLRQVIKDNTISLILVHHTRKMYDPDPLNTLSGSTGLVGAVDGVWVLEKEKRTENKGKLTIANRDTKGYCFKVELDDNTCKWKFLGIDTSKNTFEKDDTLCELLNSFFGEQWQGTATELCEIVKKADNSFSLDPRTVSRKLESISDQLKLSYGIDFKAVRTGKSRNIYLSRVRQQVEDIASM